MRYVFCSLALLLTLSSCLPSEVQRGLDLSNDYYHQKQNGASSIFTAKDPGWDIALWIYYPLTGRGFLAEGIPAANSRAYQGFLMGASLDVIQKGYDNPGDYKSRATYLELPLTPIYQYPLGPGAIQGGLGPYFAYGIGGKTGDLNTFGDGNNDAQTKHFDFGLSARLGYALNMGLRASFGYEYGLTNVIYPGNDFNAYNRGFSIDVGYEFGHLFAKNK